MSFDIWDGKNLIVLEAGDQEFLECLMVWWSIVIGDGVDCEISDRRKKIIWTEILISARLMKLDK